MPRWFAADRKVTGPMVERMRSVLLHVNAGLEYGMGHLMRAATLASEAADRGWSVTVAGDLDQAALRLMRANLSTGAVHVVRRADQLRELRGLVDGLAPDVVHIDSYSTESDALMGSAPVVSNVQDGGFGARLTDLTIDPTLGAETAFVGAARADVRLAGVAYAPIRRQVREARGSWARSTTRSRVLVVLGGTDPHRVTPRLVEAMLADERDMQLTVVAPASVHDQVRRMTQASGRRADVVGFLDDLPAAAVRHDLVVSAAGTSVWDLACMGVPTALVCVTENQERGYDAAVARGLAVGLQRSPQRPWKLVAQDVGDMLQDADVLQAMSRLGMEIVDGLGAWRVVGAWESLLDAVKPSPGDADLTSRHASITDAHMLFEWRNDPDTRRMSRSTDEVSWDEHIHWITRVLDDASRILLIIEHDGRPVGTVRWDHRSGIDWEVSIALSPSARGQGLSFGVLAAGESGLPSGVHRLVAAVNVENTASRRLFERSGYLPYAPQDARGFAEYAKLSSRGDDG